jgi:hypothetical protein
MTFHFVLTMNSDYKLEGRCRTFGNHTISASLLAMFKWIIGLVLAVLLVAAGLTLFRGSSDEPVREVVKGDEEARIIAYLKDNVRPGQPVYVTDLYNTVFTSAEERAVLERLHKIFFQIPAFAAITYQQSGKIPTLQDISGKFGLAVPGEADVLLRVMESDPRVPKFFERDPATGEITSIDVDRIGAEQKFGEALRNR